MNPADMLALLPVKPEDKPGIATIKNKPTRASIKAFQESIQDQAMDITTCYNNLGIIRMALRASYYDTLSNRNPFVPPTDPGPAPVHSTGTPAQITEDVCLYKDYKEKFTTYCEFLVSLISIITNKCP